MGISLLTTGLKELVINESSQIHKYIISMPVVEILLYNNYRAIGSGIVVSGVIHDLSSCLYAIKTLYTYAKIHQCYPQSMAC